LHTADPTDAGTGAEVSGFGYARQAMAFDVHLLAAQLLTVLLLSFLLLLVVTGEPLPTLVFMMPQPLETFFSTQH
jgi:hypothetical protein